MKNERGMQLDKVLEEGKQSSGRRISLRLWILFAFVGLLLVSIYNLPFAVERMMHKSLQDVGYDDEIKLSAVSWASGGFEFQSLQARGKGLPQIKMGKTHLWLEPAKLWDADLALRLNSKIFDGNMTIQFSHQWWLGQSKAEATVSKFSIAQLVAAIPEAKQYFPSQTSEQTLVGQLGLEVTGVWRDTQHLVPSVNADVIVKQLHLPASINNPALAVQSIELKGLQYSPAAKTPARIQIADVTLKGLKTPNMALQTDEQVFPFHLDKLQVSKLEMVAENGLNIGGLDMLGVQAGLDEKPLFKLQNLKFKKVRWQAKKGLSLAEVVLDKGEISADIDVSGHFSAWKLWLAALPLAAKDTPKKPADTKQASEGEAFTVSIQKASIQALQVKFNDASKKPAVHLPMEIQSLSAEDMVLAKGGHPIVWQAKGLLGAQGQWQANGKFSPFALEQAADGKLHIQSFELSPLSGYFAKSYGKGIRSGNLDFNLSVQVEQGLLKADGDLFARKVSFSDVKGVTGTSSTMMPLDSALDVLKDGDDNITLQFSSEGKLDDPSFKLSGIWDKVLSKAASNSAMFMLGQALQPYALVLTAGEFLYDQSKHINLKPIVFVQGDATGADAQPDMQAYTIKISDLLRSKTSLLLEICPRYTLSEGEAGEKLSLARGQLLTNQLLQLGVSANRMTNCLPELDGRKKAKPRLELSLI